MCLSRREQFARLLLIWTAIATVALVLVGCIRVVDGRARMAEPKLGQPVQWTPCRSSNPAVKIPGGALCGKLAVPVDYAHPDGDIAALALIRFPATGDKIGSLVINPGGPGESGIEAALGVFQSLPKRVHERFDLVGFDPRGVASSRPALWCNSDADNDRLRAEPQVDYSPAGVARIEEETRQFVSRCVAKMGKKFLANVGTVNVAKDLDAIRAALGDDKLTYLGYSYGTRIGSAYAEAYPQRVRAMILDGAVDPNADPIEADLRQAKGFQDAFNDYAADCAKDGSCPLGNDPAKAVDVYHSLVDPLVDPDNLQVSRPAHTNDPRGLSYSDAIVGTIMALYSPNLWSHLTDGLSELADHRGDTLLALADMYMRRDSHGHYTNATDARVAINCVDQPPITDRAKIIDEDRRSRELAPFMSYGKFTGDAPLGTCAFWPVPPTSKPHVVYAPDLVPTIVVSTTHDPATPYKAGVDLASQLHGSLLTFNGTQHTVVFQGDSCIDDYVTAYLIGGTTPPSGAKC
ncbi:alpha/beta hydrolase [Mycobacterium kansasii]|uniref:Alpha/beta hydrolase fold family protein n=3 Tax=Mycobacterium kansasii TaxID=1768 RepID=A0A1V3WM66_MYCKA|nr:alpha/beta hydrolase [Mycobacterium kansasii]EUA00759.1 alpha/beta hydrolase fold family protein [Mycobacterium kansasii 824]AGZ49394.1 hydrolase [Mycobacterium kansasii ATCC 12478]ARG58660.1 alpha/beta hydrolase [Mycobacterium kansasii]ARG64175.1 alpha/beta hydrolase [Mycobacterium kansasii]ARG71827.1 alpha/beta hydrolase [Mycobacterium kansasii]